MKQNRTTFKGEFQEHCGFQEYHASLPNTMKSNIVLNIVFECSSACCTVQYFETSTMLHVKKQQPVVYVLDYLYVKVSSISYRVVGSIPIMHGKTLTQQL